MTTSRPGAAELRAALTRAGNATGADKARAVSDAGRLGIEITRDVQQAAGRDTARQFSDAFEDELRQA
ncbi:hypothetical protein [Saccharothrix obliqua]|uniref:hypothetical protein n=1 Tax=Saccharothrix obliqua TaxID=2861747 RepID=UPI001C5F17EC|nr:hypothetical protein [Saccharothrix obliqua]MBW4722385.1 hypothetical protein [Saccharothrix obliqua]